MHNKTMKIKYLLILVLLLTQASYAQVKTLKGKVIDSLTNQAIPYANVGVPHLSIGTFTNENGEFILKIPLGLMMPSTKK
jgi:TonB-dependent starch-binding outer membrane protein SusC